MKKQTQDERVIDVAVKEIDPKKTTRSTKKTPTRKKKTAVEAPIAETPNPISERVLSEDGSVNITSLTPSKRAYYNEISKVLDERDLTSVTSYGSDLQRAMGSYSSDFLKQSFEAGFTRFAHVRNDDDLEEIRKMDGYKKLIDEYETKYLEDQEKKKKAEGGTQLERKEYVCEIPFTVEGGNCYVKCQINELPMRFVFDTGAADVSISMVEASFMMKNGYLTEKDVIGSGRFSDAIGNVSEGTVINLKKVKFGDLELDNVRASVVRNQKAPLLLGQTVLSRIGKIEIDNQKKVIVVKYMK